MPRRELHRPIDQRHAWHDRHIREVTIETSKVGRDKEIKFCTISERSNAADLRLRRTDKLGIGQVTCPEKANDVARAALAERVGWQRIDKTPPARKACWVLRFGEHSAPPPAAAKAADIGQIGGIRGAWNDCDLQLRCGLVEYDDRCVDDPGETAQLLLQLGKADALAFDLNDGVTATAEAESAVHFDIHAVRADMFTTRHVQRAHAQKSVPAALDCYAWQGAPGHGGAISAAPGDSACFGAAEDFGNRDAEDRRGDLSGLLG